MVTVGIDPHKSTLTAVAVNEVGRQLAQITVPNRDEGFVRLYGWCARFDTLPLFAVEDGRGVASRLVSALLATGAQVVWVPPKLMTQVRASARTRGKSDAIDALAVARAALREPDLPQARLEEQAVELRLLTDRRSQLVTDRTRAINQLRWLVVALDPAREPAARTLTSRRVRDRLDTWLATLPAGVRRDLARELLADIARLSERITTLEREISALITPMAPALLAIAGVGPVTAATIVAHTAGITRFRSSAAFAMHNGTAPIPVTSGRRTPTYRLNRYGNRTLNACLHRIALTQLSHHPPARDFRDRWSEQHPHATSKAALRALKRHLSDTIYHALNTDHHQRQQPDTAAAA